MVFKAYVETFLVNVGIFHHSLLKTILAPPIVTLRASGEHCSALWLSTVKSIFLSCANRLDCTTADLIRAF